MKKQFFLFIFFLFFSNLYAQKKINWFTNQFDFSLKNGIYLENGSDFAPLTQAVDTQFSLDMKELYAGIGTKFQPDKFDYTSIVVYWPSFGKHFNAGIGSIFHLEIAPNYYIESNFSIGPFFKFDTLKWFYMAFELLYLHKFSYIEITKNDYFTLHNNDMLIGVELGFRLPKNFTIMFNFSSYSFYRYMLFFAPDFRLTVSYDISKMFAIATEVELQYIDMFTLSSNINSFTTHTYVKVRF